MHKTIKTILAITIILATTSSSLLASNSYQWQTGKSGIDFIDDASIELEKSIINKDRFFKKLYSGLYYTPVWVGEKGLTKFGKSLMEIIANDKTLDPSMRSKQKYQSIVKELDKIVDQNGTSLKQKVALELELGSMYKSYMDYIILGGIDWGKFKSKLSALQKAKKADFGWIVYTDKTTSLSVLMNAISSGDLKTEILKAEPTRFGYKKLKKYLIKYIDMQNQGKWNKLPKYHKKITLGKSDKSIPLIRENLKLEGDLDTNCKKDVNSSINKYDKCLGAAIKRFKIRNGLRANSTIGKSTYRALNTPVSKKITLIRMNMDRIKRSRRDESKVRMELNIPSFRLNIFDGQKLLDSIRVVVGKRNHHTPIFGSKVQYIVVNPWWKIPESIVKTEMMRHLVKDPYYYEKRGKILKATWDENSQRIDPGSIDWGYYASSGASVPYRFMQVPSRRNALGKIKFIFPNQFSVYIHDTPSKKLFFRTDRAFSHGCMRIQKPRELLKAFALYNDNINVDAIMKRLQGVEKKTIGLKHKLPVDITYFTAFVDPYGNINFRKDVYGYDKYTLKNYKYIPDTYTNKSTKKKRKEKREKRSPIKSTKGKQTKKAKIENTPTPKKTDDNYQVIETY